MNLLLFFFIFVIFVTFFMFILVLLIPLSKKVFYIGTSIAGVVISLPLLSFQSLAPRPGLYWYPVFLISLALLVAWGLTRVSGFASGRDSEPALLHQMIFVAVACFSAGFFISWLSAIGTDLRNGWRGVILMVNVLTAVVGLLGGFWSAIAVRLLRNPLTTISRERPVLVTTGCIVIQLLWVFILRINHIPAIWTILAILKAASPDDVMPPDVIAYFLLEAFAGQVVWPFVLLLCVYAVYCGDQSIIEADRQ
jgi:hypothetical protein